jgi:hypothetical protein
MGFPVSTRATDDLITAAIWNADLVDNMNNGVWRKLASKGTDQSVTSSTVLVNATDLSFTFGANEIWQFDQHLLFSAALAADIKLAWTFPSGTVWINAAFYDTASTMDVEQSNGIATGVSVPLGSIVTPTDNQLVVVHTTFVAGGTGGTFQGQFAQQASNATATILRKGTSYVGMKIA